MNTKWWTLLAVCTGTFMLLPDVTIVIVAQPAIRGGRAAGRVHRRKDFVQRAEPQAAPAGDGQAMRVAGWQVRSVRK
jgi:hypothetical protein